MKLLKKVTDKVAYLKGYEDAQNNEAIQQIQFPGSRLSYLIGYKQHLLDHADAIQVEIDRTKKELDNA